MPLKNSVNEVLKVRHQDRRVAQISPATAQRIAQGELPSGPSTYGKVGRARVFGMPGESAPHWDDSHHQNDPDEQENEASK